MEEVSRTQQWRHQVLVLAFPFGSHPGCLLSLVRRLADEAPAVKFSFFSTASSNAVIFNDGRRNHNVFPYSVGDGLPEGYVRRRGVPAEPAELFLKAGAGNFSRAVAAEMAGVEVGGVVSDAFLWFAGDMAAEMEVPWVPVWVPGLRSLVVHLHTDLFRRNLDSGDYEEKVINFLPGFSKIRKIDLPEGIVQGDLESPISTTLHKIGLYLRKASAVVVNSFKEAEPEMFDILKPMLRELLTTAPINLTPSTSIISDEHDCVEWLDKQKPKSVAYISFGTFISLPPHELAALSEALVESGVRFLWSFRGNPQESFTEDFLQTVDVQENKLVAWAPQTRVLAHPSIGVFISHCGWNSALEAIMAGVPMICRPFIGDNGLNVRTLEFEWKAGLGLPNGIFTKDGVIRAMDTIFDPYKGVEIRNNLKALKDLAFEAAGPEGSSTKNFNTLVKLLVE